MDQQAKPTDTQHHDSPDPSEAADATRICWTQLLRETDSADEQQRPLQRSPSTFSIEKLFS